MQKATKDVGNGIAHLDNHKQINQVESFSLKPEMHICSRLDCCILHLNQNTAHKYDIISYVQTKNKL